MPKGRAIAIILDEAERDELTALVRKRGVFHSVRELETAIHSYIEATSAEPKPFRWAKTADEILASIQRFCLRTLSATA
jgi:hypothetical protein